MAPKGDGNSLDRVVRPPRSGGCPPDPRLPWRRVAPPRRRAPRGDPGRLARRRSGVEPARAWTFPTLCRRRHRRRFPTSRCRRSPRSPRARPSRAAIRYVEFTAAVANVGRGALHRPRRPCGRTRQLARLAVVRRAGRLDERDRHRGRRRLGRPRPRALARAHGGLVLADPAGIGGATATLRQGRVLLLRPAPARRPAARLTISAAVPQERVQRRGHARVHDGPLPRLGRSVPVDAPRPAAARGRPRGRRLPPLGRPRIPATCSASRTRPTTSRGSTSVSR